MNYSQMKTITQTSPDGSTFTTVFDLQIEDYFGKDARGAIVIVQQNGKSLQNEYGGYPTRNVGKKAYLTRIFNSL